MHGWKEINDNGLFIILSNILHELQCFVLFLQPKALKLLGMEVGFSFTTTKIV